MNCLTRTKMIWCEYKVMLDRRAFADPVAALPQFWQELGDFTRSREDYLESRFDPANPKERQVVFFDTIGFTLLENGLVLRRRGKPGGRKAQSEAECAGHSVFLSA